MEVRYRQLKLRAEFEKNLSLKDMRKVKELMDQQEKSLKPIFGEEPVSLYPFNLTIFNCIMNY